MPAGSGLSNTNWMNKCIQTQTRSWLLKSPSQGSSGSYCWFAYTNNGHWSPETAISPLESFVRTLNQQVDEHKNKCQEGTNSVSFQSRPAGQRSAPVAGWWKPRFVLTFRERGGSKGVSRPAIHSRITPFKLLVSSDLALDTPFWILKKWGKVCNVLKQWTY